ncbi:3-hydroxyacyl-CoA dehydrogenase NAD-binding domain-containing protein [Candidatus Pelagibacter sp.]|nr:3-hydroxyacyl-CoA dehydrogenase NAD-binding domain-containing protein [Candidatus Pelagibacter sp.]
MSNKNSLFSLIDSKKITVGVVGLGYVGLPLSILFAKKGFRVIGFDIDQNKIRKLKKGTSYLSRISKQDIKIISKKDKQSKSWKCPWDKI